MSDWDAVKEGRYHSFPDSSAEAPSPEERRQRLEQVLGFTPEEFKRATRSGRPRAEDRELRTRVDVRIAELHACGISLTKLAQGFGLSRQALGRAAARGRKLSAGREVWR